MIIKIKSNHSQIEQPRDVCAFVNAYLDEKQKQRQAGRGKMLQAPSSILRAAAATDSNNNNVKSSSR